MADRRRKAKKTRRSSSLLLVFIALFALVAVLYFSAENVRSDLNELRAREATLEAELEYQQDRQEKLEEQSKYIKTRKYIEETARDRLGLVYDGETVFKSEDSP